MSVAHFDDSTSKVSFLLSFKCQYYVENFNPNFEYCQLSELSIEYIFVQKYKLKKIRFSKK